MKNVILGITATAFVLLSCFVCLTLFGGSSRNNELEHGLGRTVKSTLEKYYDHGDGNGVYPSKVDLEREIATSLGEWISSESTLTVSVKVYDFEKGILSVNVLETYETPMGRKKTNSYSKTAIAERSVS